jgi:hypothetical protein
VLIPVNFYSNGPERVTGSRLLTGGQLRPAKRVGLGAVFDPYRRDDAADGRWRFLNAIDW